MKPAFRAAAFALLAGSWPSFAMAHDFFLLPDQFRGDRSVELQATVGAAFPVPEIVVGEDRIAELRASEGATLVVAGAGSQSLRLTLTADRQGAHVAGIRLLPRDVDYEADRIPLIMEEYAVSDDIVQAVAALPSPRVLRVTSERFAKTIVCSQTCTGDSAARAFSYPLEFVADASDTNQFHLLLNGRPLPNYTIAIATSGERAHARTDAEGRVVLDFAAEGPIMLFAAHMALPAESNGRFGMLLTSLTISSR